MSNKINFEELATRFIQGGNYNLGDIWPDPDPILKKMNKDARAYADIRSDAKVAACIESRKAGTTSMEWSLEKTDDTNSFDVIEHALKRLDLTNIISQALEAVLFGYQPLEIIWEKQEKYILPAAVIAKPAEWFVFDTENKLRLKTKNNPKGEELPERKFLLAQHNPTYANPYGDKVISRCFWPVTFKKGGWKFWVTFSEKYGMPFLLGKVPRGTNSKEQEELLETLIALASDAVGVIPNDSTIDFIESKNNSGSSNSFKELIEQCNSEIALAIVGQTLSTEVGDKGSYAASKTHNDVRKEIIDADKKMVESVINQLCRWIHEINFSSGEAPVWFLWQETDIDKDLAERDKILTETGIKFTKEYYIRNYGLKEDDFEILPTPAPSSAPASADTSIPKVANFAAPEREVYDPEMAETPSAKEYNKITRQLTEKVLELIEKSDNYEEVMQKLFKLFPEIDTKELENSLGKALYIAGVEGRLND